MITNDLICKTRCETCKNKTAYSATDTRENKMLKEMKHGIEREATDCLSI